MQSKPSFKVTDQTEVTQDIRTGVYNLAIYFPDSRKLFIHFPKTGGTWIRKAAMEAGIANVQLPRRTSAGSHKHLTRDFYRCPVDFVWTLVRRPDDWYVSWFRYAQHHSWPEYRNTAAHPQTCLSDCMADTFEGFIEHCLTKHPGYLSEMYALYTEGADFVGTTENIVSDFRMAMNLRSHIPIDSRAVHASGGPVPQWPNGLRQELLATEEPALKIWERAKTSEPAVLQERSSVSLPLHDARPQ